MQARYARAPMRRRRAHVSGQRNAELGWLEHRAEMCVPGSVRDFVPQIASAMFEQRYADVGGHGAGGGG